MRKSILVTALLAILLAGCSTDTATKSAQPEETTADTATGSTQPEETTAQTVAQQETTATTGPPRSWVTAIGDSVMIGAIDALQRKITNLALIDAQGSRQPPDAVDILQKRHAASQLGDVVIVHVGNNGPFTKAQFDEMMQVLTGIRKVVVVNLTVPPRVEDPIAVPNNAVLDSGVQRYPNTVLVDLHAASVNHPEFFGEDGIHLTLEGTQAYAGLIAAYLGDNTAEGSVAPPGPQEKFFWGQEGSFAACVGPPSWCTDP